MISAPQSAPGLNIDIDKIGHNIRTLVECLAVKGISVTGITKAMLGSSRISNVMLNSGINMLGDSRIQNIEAMQNADVQAPMTLIRSPVLSQITRTVLSADTSHNTELDVISALSTAAHKAGRIHSVILMIELGDLREGIMPGDLEDIVRKTLSFPNILFKGIGTNLACRSGISPDAKNMAELSTLANSIDATFNFTMNTVSGGNSSNLGWALSGADTGRINNLRLGEAIFLGLNPLHREPVEGLYTDAITLTAEVIEAKIKPSQPWGESAQAAFGTPPPVTADQGFIFQALLAIGEQDTDPNGLTPPAGMKIIGASSDHLIINSGAFQLAVGDKISFLPGYSALVRAMTSPYVYTYYNQN